jgi:hypothetical protein
LGERGFYMKDGGKAVATVAIWVGVAILSYLFNSFGILSGDGAAWMVIGAILLTVILWD